MTPLDVLGIFAIILLFGGYMIISPILEGMGKKNKGKGGNQFKILDEIGERIRRITRWVNRQ